MSWTVESHCCPCFELMNCNQSLLKFKPASVYCTEAKSQPVIGLIPGLLRRKLEEDAELWQPEHRSSEWGVEQRGICTSVSSLISRAGQEQRCCSNSLIRNHRSSCCCVTFHVLTASLWHFKNTIGHMCSWVTAESEPRQRRFWSGSVDVLVFWTGTEREEETDNKKKISTLHNVLLFFL